MKLYRKSDFPVENVRRYLEPGPIVMVSSFYKGERDIMTMGWHMVLSEGPSQLACMIWDQNHSHELIRKSKECVINVPTLDIAETVVRIGNSSGEDMDKFEAFGLTPQKASKVKAPLIGECFASFECQLSDARMVKKYNLFIFDVVKAHVSRTPHNPKTMHYRGDGEFMLSGALTRKFRKLFRADYLE